MADELRIGLKELLRKARMEHDADLLKEGVRVLSQALMEMEVEGVHFMRNALSLVPKAAQQMVGATIRTVFAQPDAQGAREQWRRVSEGFRSRFPRLSELMDEAEEDLLSYAAFPQEHWQKIWSNNPLERLNKEVKRRTNVVGIFPNEAAVVRLVGSVLSEQHDEWQVSKRYFSAGSLAKLERKEEATEQPQLMGG
jgi:putative transposase